MFPKCHVPVLFTVLSLLTLVRCVTVYGPTGVIGATTSTTSTGAPDASYTNGAAAYNNVVLQAPPVPQPPPPTQFSIQLQNSAQGLVGLSIPQSGSFYGFSIEMSVVDQIIGINSTFLNVQFLNLMSLLQARGGRVHIRVGGNTQDTATVVPSLPNGKAIMKDKANATSPTQTPILTITPELIYMLANVSSLVNTKWYLGIPMNDTSNLRLQIAEVGEAILGSNLIGLQLGNEPDLYAGHQHRSPEYSAADYAAEFGVVVQAIAHDPGIPVRNNLIGPSVASGPWKPEDVWNTGFITTYSDTLGALAVEHYPDNNCAQAFPNGDFGPLKNPQDVFANYLNHTSGVSMAGMYLSSTRLAQQAGKPFLMFETNTASCGGFPGVSDSFGAALWALDYGLQMAFSNFSGALLHVGGQSDTYNPFTPPPTNQSTFHQWTIGPVFYSAVAVAEAFGTSNNSQIIDIQANGGNMYTPGYAIYDSGVLSKVALFNYITDPTGASDYTATISVLGGSLPAQVYVKYLLAPSVSEKHNITWAGQTLGGQFQSDGRLQGAELIQRVPCDQARSTTCTVKVPAPGFALVFLSSGGAPADATATFPTTTMTRTVNTASVDASALATAQGQSGVDRQHRGSTSKGSSGAARAAGARAPWTVLCAVTLFGILLGRTL